MNFLEQLVAEWYVYNGYFVHTNVKFGKRPSGGYEGEMDVVAFDPKRRILIHLETSTGAESWKQRETKCQKKFGKAKKYYKSVFDFDFKKVEKIAIIGFPKPKNSPNLGDGVKLTLIPEIMTEITKEVSKFPPTKKAIPENYSFLRAIQFSVWYGKGEQN